MVHTSKTKDTMFECTYIQIQILPDEIVMLLRIHIDNMMKFTQHITGDIRNFSTTHFSDILNYSTQNQVIYFSFIHSGQTKLFPTYLDQ